MEDIEHTNSDTDDEYPSLPLPKPSDYIYPLVIGIDPGEVNLAYSVIAGNVLVNRGTLDLREFCVNSEKDETGKTQAPRKSKGKKKYYMKEETIIKSVVPLLQRNTCIDLVDFIVVEHQMRRRYHNIVAALIAVYPQKTFVVSKASVNRYFHFQRAGTGRINNKVQSVPQVKALIKRNALYPGTDLLEDITHDQCDSILIACFFIFSKMYSKTT